MKIFFKIFLFYFFSLVLLPCNEADACVQPINNVVELKIQDNKATHEHQDDCSPLCSCMCCNHCVVKTLESTGIDIAVFHKTIVFTYMSSLVSMHYPIWQPPKLN